MIGGNLAFGIGWWGANQSGSSSGKSCRKILWENLAGQGEREKAKLRKAVIGGNLAFGIGWWEANQSGSSLGKSCGKILWEILAGNAVENLLGNCCWKFLWEIVVGYCWRKIFWENLAGNSCGKILWEILWEILAGNCSIRVIRSLCESSPNI